MPWRRWLPLALAAALLSPAGAARSVSGVRIAGVAYAPVDAVARALGDIVAPGAGSLTWRAARGTLTVFDGSPDALWQAVGERAAHRVGLSAPALLRDGRWWLPLDALDILGVGVEGTTLTLPDGRRLTVAVPAPRPGAGDGRSQVDELGNGVPVLRLFPVPAAGASAASGPAAADAAGASVAAMLADLDMLPLVDPAQRAVIDAAVERSGPDKPLLVIVTALRDSPWEATFTLSQAGRSLEFRYPYRMRLVGGSPRRVGPASPASMLLLLPGWFNLYRPIAVSWQGATGTITFRR